MRGVIAENILLLKYQKQGITTAFNGKRCPYVVTYCLEKIVDIPTVAFYLFIVSPDTSLIGNNVTYREFYWSADHEFYTRLGIENCKSV